MQVILLKDIENLGNKSEIVKVKDGYARNYLIPKGVAIRVTKSNIKVIEERRKKLEKERKKEIKTIEELKDRIESINDLVIKKKAGEEETLFGSVTSADIEEKLKEFDIEVNKKKIELPKPIKKLGEYNVDIKIHPNMKATLKFTIEEEKDEE